MISSFPLSPGGISPLACSAAWDTADDSARQLRTTIPSRPAPSTPSADPNDFPLRTHPLPLRLHVPLLLPRCFPELYHLSSRTWWTSITSRAPRSDFAKITDAGKAAVDAAGSVGRGGIRSEEGEFDVAKVVGRAEGETVCESECLIFCNRNLVRRILREQVPGYEQYAVRK